MVDIEGAIVTILDAIDGIAVWRNRLPAGFTNTSKAATVMVENDIHHLTGATRAATVRVRVYGGTAKASDLRAATDAVVGALMMKNTSSIAIIGNIRTQYLPPEPDTGWLSSTVRFSARIKE